MKVTADELKYFAKHFLKKLTMEHSAYYKEMARLKLDPKLAQIAEKLSQMNPQDMGYIHRIAKLAMRRNVFNALSHRQMGSQWFYDWIQGIVFEIKNDDHSEQYKARIQEAVEVIEYEQKQGV